MEKKHFENVKNQIGACGIWCGSCMAGNGVLQVLTQKYAKIITDYGLEQWAPKDFDFEEFKKGLSSIQEMLLCAGCLKGGGRDDCEIRICVTDKMITDCGECNEPGKCTQIEILDKMRTGAKEAGLFVKMDTTNNQTLIAQWTDQLKSDWPSSILFMDDKS
ncbi:DUF3795 domain-containing protein [Acidobacteriota bacterium]